jgi:hypothetical protein
MQGKPAVKIHMDSCVTGTRNVEKYMYALNNFVCNSLSNYCWYYFVLEAPLILHTHVKCHSRAAAVRIEKRILLLGLAWLEPSISHRSHLYIYNSRVLRTVEKNACVRKHAKLSHPRGKNSRALRYTGGAGWVVSVEIDAEFRSDLELASVNKWPHHCRARKWSWWFWCFIPTKESFYNYLALFSRNKQAFPCHSLQLVLVR